MRTTISRLLKKAHLPAQSKSGQAVTEYILLLFVVITLFGMVSKWMKTSEFTKTIEKSVTGDWQSAYAFGDPLAKDPETNDTPERHPRYPVPDGVNFKLFIVKQ